MIKKEVENGKIEGFRVCPQGTEMTHLQFADDTLFFLDCDKDRVKVLKNIIKMFSPCSGLKINFTKSVSFQIGGQDLLHWDLLHWAAQLLDCSVSKLPTTYFGLPLRSKERGSEIWNTILEKIQ